MSRVRDQRASACGRVSAPDEAAGPLEVGGSIDTERNSVNDRRRRCACRLRARAAARASRAARAATACSDDEALERRAAIGIDADVVVERAVAIGRGGAREVERAQAPRARRAACRRPSRRWDWCAPPARRSRRRAWRCRRPPSASGARHALTRCGSSVGRSPCRLTMMSARAVRIDAAHRLEDAVRARGVIGAASSPLRRRPPRWRRRSRRCRLQRPPARLGGDGAAPDVHDHRLAGDVGHRLAGQARRLHARRDDDECARHLRQLCSSLDRWQLVSGRRT